ncbi:hypothetical protein B0H63DRAFT_187851 [Podospora didyma]|uniref:Apple domain-containing protein n=1 Tax=Podospora didyma TaxID=330526 RepID=A0AAE0U004_9PEZI|nr:hypothetical protein B0H63DRAFT_187851 [Podospora didyma]
MYPSHAVSSLLVLAGFLSPALALSKCACKKNPVLSVLSAAETASEFCSTFLGIQTQTVTVSPSTTVSTVVVALETETITVPLTATASTLVTSTKLSTTTTTHYLRNAGGPAQRRRAIVDREVPPGLEQFPEVAISTACSCYIGTTSTSAATVTVTSAYATTETSTSTDITTITVSPTVTTTTATAVTETTATSTVTVEQQLTYVARYTSHCVPYNYQTLDFGLTAPSLTFEVAFQLCAAKCWSYVGCTQIYVGYDGGSNFDCMTGTTGSFGWDASEFQCNYPPIHQYGYWFSR